MYYVVYVQCVSIGGHHEKKLKKKKRRITLKNKLGLTTNLIKDYLKLLEDFIS